VLTGSLERGRRRALLERHEREPVVRIHGDDQLVCTSVKAHRSGTRNVAGDELSFLSRTHPRDASVRDATHVFRPIWHDHETVAARLRRLLRLQQLAAW